MIQSLHGALKQLGYRLAERACTFERIDFVP